MMMKALSDGLLCSCTNAHPHTRHTRHTHERTPHASVYGGPLTHPLIESNECGVIRLGMSHHTHLIY